MAFDGICMRALALELNRQLSDTHVNKIAQPEPEELLLTLKGNGSTHKLLISANASLPLIYLTGETKVSPLNAPVFCMMLRKHIGSGHLLSVDQCDFERVLKFTFEAYDELGDLSVKYLYVEIMGKHSNIIFCDSENRIIDSIKRISFTTSSVREVLPGRDYFIPTQEGKISPSELDAGEFIFLIKKQPTTVVKALYSSIIGLSPVMATEICQRAGIDGDQSLAALSENEYQTLSVAFSSFYEEIEAGHFSPVLYTDASDVPKEFSPIPLKIYGDYKEVLYTSVSELLSDFYSRKNTYTNMQQKSSDLRKVVSTLKERAAKKYSLQSRQLQDTEKMEKYRIYGELLHTYGHSIPSGSKSCTLNNYYSGQDVTIPLDETISPVENGNRYFEKYQKCKRTKEALTGQLQETEEALKHLESIETALSLAENQADLDVIHKELAQYGYIKKHSAVKKKTSEKSAPIHYVTEDGYHIYVGKNNEQNDYLTFKLASGNDWWFHTKKIHGSHVIVKNPEGGQLPDSVYEIAANLAAYYSSGREAGRVEVDYLQKKNVKKPNNAVAGFVVYYTNFSMVAKPGIEGVTRLDH